MKAFIVGFFAIIAVATASDPKYCYKDALEACSATKQSTSLENCNANYGSITRIAPYLQSFANSHIIRSFEYLLMSTHFANYEKNRLGFEKLYRDLSDKKWDEAIDIIKYITKRGGRMDFNQRYNDDINVNPPEQSYELYEIQSLAKSIDMEKQMAQQAFNIHDQAVKKRKEDHDPEISSWIEKEFVHKHADNIRQLSGFTADLNSMLRTQDSALSLFLFDEYLQKL